MDFNLSNMFKNKDSVFASAVFYFLNTLFIILLFSYVALVFKTNLQNQTASALNESMTTYPQKEQKADEKMILDYKKKINGYSALFSNRTISSTIFKFLEEHTVANVWFSDFDISQSVNEIRISGEAANMETLARQIQFFEQSPDYIKHITILNSVVGPLGTIRFVLSLDVSPGIFKREVIQS